MRFFIFVLFLISFVTYSAQAQTDTLSENREFLVRDGLPNFFQKLQKGGPVSIAYFGGSITEAGNGWREQSLKWFQQQYPKTNLTHINAAIGGTGSDLGVFRLQQQVLVHKPDLIFVEFAVNDGSQQPARIHKAMEGIVRQIWRQNRRTDICFVYTLNASMAPSLLAHRMPNSVRAMEEIANHYGIPSVHMGLEVIRLDRQGKLVWGGKKEEFPDKIVFSPDKTHPYSDTGHRLYTEALSRAMQQIKTAGRPGSHPVPKPFVSDNWEDAQMISVQSLTRQGDWQELTPTNDTVARQLRNRFSYLIKSNQPGASIQFKFRGTMAGIYDVIGPGCGQYAVTIDDKTGTLYPRFDSYATYYRSHYFFLPTLDEGTHTITLTVSPELLDKAAILKNRNQTITDPHRYSENAGYASQLLIIGKLEK
ncbi:SGNH/GDSL hydrolase family protein [Larkinella rosea]|uniref:SGNH/GDSL hydrolase family protein n=1 Tax=Larkinella rosea TaxID=2025312 RepID=A0A3P1BM62_9BACT|nr:SGNH/GDSL hydrolase family protein [Larkinella rosea]RRB02157.1 SGNH/GDSL hydrolase family protein [Larkinella rosea]